MGDFAEKAWRYSAKVEPRADGRWEVSVWSEDPMWKRSRGCFPAEVAKRLDLFTEDTCRIVRTEGKARRAALKMLRLCEKRHAALYDREGFNVCTTPTQDTP